MHCGCGCVVFVWVVVYGVGRSVEKTPTNDPHHQNQPNTEIDAVLKLRKRLQKEYEAAFSVNDVIIRSAALALRDVPEVGAGV